MSAIPWVEPDTLTLISVQTETVSFDFSNRLSGGESLSTGPTASLWDLTANQNYANGLGGSSATVSSASVTQVITGLVAGHDYRLVIGVTVSANKKPAAALRIRCPF